MIKNILDLLKIAKGDTENIRIAQGKLALPKDMKQAFRLIKKTVNNGSKGI
tara:strand:+ start:725 stop:877 length:153 start_codon:yes stop_codon:yes gene_type:complete